MRAMAGRGLRRRQRHRAAQGRRRWRSPTRQRGRAGDRRRQHAHLRRRADPGRQHRRRRPARRAARLAAGQRALVLGAGGAARAAVWALRHRGRDVDVWNRTAPGRSARGQPGAAPGAPDRGRGQRAIAVRAGSTRPERLRADRQHDRGRPAAARTRSSTCRCAADGFVAAPGRRRHGLRRRAVGACWRPRRPPGRPPSTASRSSSSRARSRCRSGPGASRRSTSMRAAARAGAN